MIYYYYLVNFYFVFKSHKYLSLSSYSFNLFIDYYNFYSYINLFCIKIYYLLAFLSSVNIIKFFYYCIFDSNMLFSFSISFSFKSIIFSSLSISFLTIFSIYLLFKIFFINYLLIIQFIL